MKLYLTEEDKENLADIIRDARYVSRSIGLLGVKLLEENEITLVLEEED